MSLGEGEGKESSHGGALTAGDVLSEWPVWRLRWIFAAWGGLPYETADRLALAFAATLYPSWRASCVNPAQALRYE